MSANPLQDNGNPRYDWLKRIVVPIQVGMERGQIVIDGEIGELRAYPGWLKKIIRREIVRVARSFVGYRQWRMQCGESAYIHDLERYIHQLRGQNKAMRATLKQHRLPTPRREVESDPLPTVET